VKQANTKRKLPGAVRAGSSLGSFSRKLPALARAQRVTERASHLGFDWPEPGPVWGKIEEELSELKSAVASGDEIRIKEEMGDLFFSLVNLSRFLELEAEEALSQTIDRFLKRFSHIEAKIRERGKTLTEASLEEMDLLWEEAKRMAGKIQP